jgi:hypothetical protein
LRLDKVATRLISDVEAGLQGDVPDGTIVVFTVTAPIRLASKTADALEGKIRELLARRAKKVEVEQKINGNGVRVRVIRTGSLRAPTVLGFVHNPEPGAAEALLDAVSVQR